MIQCSAHDESENIGSIGFCHPPVDGFQVWRHRFRRKRAVKRKRRITSNWRPSERQRRGTVWTSTPTANTKVLELCSLLSWLGFSALFSKGKTQEGRGIERESPRCPRKTRFSHPSFDTGDTASALSFETPAVTICFRMSRRSRSRSRKTLSSPPISNGSVAPHHFSSRRSCCVPMFVINIMSTDKELAWHHHVCSRRNDQFSSCCVRPSFLGGRSARIRISSIIGSANLLTSIVNITFAMTFS